MNKAALMLRIPVLQAHIDSLTAWREEERAACLKAHYEQIHAFEMCRALTKSLNVLELEMEILKGVK